MLLIVYSTWNLPEYPWLSSVHVHHKVKWAIIGLLSVCSIISPPGSPQDQAFHSTRSKFHSTFLQEAPAEWSCPWSSRRLGIITILQEAPAEWWSPGSSRRMGVYGDLPVPQKLPPTWHTPLCMSRKLPPNGHTVTRNCHTHLRSWP